MEKLIITAAIQGAELKKENTPYLPITSEEVSKEAYRAWQAGAAIIHLHVRDKHGNPTQDANVFSENIDAIKATGCKAIIQVSTGGAVGMTADERIGPITLRPEYASLNSGSVNFGDDVFINSKQMMEKIAKAIQEYGVKPEFEIYDAGHINNALELVKKGLVAGKLNFQFVLGVPGAIAPNIRNLVLLCDSIPKDATWTIAGIGKYQLELGSVAIFIGGNVRVGLEDNIYYSKGELAKGNAQFVDRIVRIAKEANREIASPDEARSILGIERAI
jgi:3-keto-5-aminohexanoate cleavage enzyme